MFKVELIVRPRDGVRDPQGDAVQEALRGLGYQHFEVQCVGRYLRMQMQAASPADARQLADEMCKKLLVNPNLETYDVAIESVA